MQLARSHLFCREEIIEKKNENVLFQGGRASPFDRNMGTKMAAKCVERMVDQLLQYKQEDGECLSNSSAGFFFFI